MVKAVFYRCLQDRVSTDNEAGLQGTGDQEPAYRPAGPSVPSANTV
jgi:hypothetical protein